MRPHGIIPLMDMLEVNNNRVYYLLFYTFVSYLNIYDVVLTTFSSHLIYVGFHEQVVYAVMQMLNLITDDDVELLEYTCHAGLVSRVMYFDLRFAAHTRIYHFTIILLILNLRLIS